MRNQEEKVATNAKGTSVYLSEEDRSALRELARLKYPRHTGFTTVLREEGMSTVFRELKRLRSELAPAS